jgi:hypothetical protein
VFGLGTALIYDHFYIFQPLISSFRHPLQQLRGSESTLGAGSAFLFAYVSLTLLGGAALFTFSYRTRALSIEGSKCCPYIGVNRHWFPINPSLFPTAT